MKSFKRRKNTLAGVVITMFILLLSGCVGVGKSNVAGKASWSKYEHNPVLGGGDLGTMFDISVIKDEGVYKMYSSWRPKRSLALSTSADGVNWSRPQIILSPQEGSWWEKDLNRPAVVKRNNLYHLWYTGQADGKSRIGYAVSTDGVNFVRQSDEPALSPEAEWEKVAVMCPHVIWDGEEEIYKMWYSGGEQYEPDAIGYAVSRDGKEWEKLKTPVFTADSARTWEQYKVTACQVIKRKSDYLMFYIGFRDIDFAQIGIARSRDGITNWERLPANPIISPGNETWDASACYKPFAIFDSVEKKWLLWYNGRNKQLERIGLATHDGEDLGFPPAATDEVKKTSAGNVKQMNNPATDWMPEAKVGVFMHFLPDSANFDAVEKFDVNALTLQLAASGVKYFVFTLGQNSGYMNAPNAAYEQIGGFTANTRCSRRDLPKELAAALKPHNIRLMLYLPCQTPNRDLQAVKNFGLPETPLNGDRRIDIEFARKWAEVIREWSQRYGKLVSGWWFDGGYQGIGFNDEIARIYAEAAKSGNSKSVVTFNPGIGLKRWTASEDYTAGELQDPFKHRCEGRWLDGSQWHVLTYLGKSWGQRDTRHTDGMWTNWVTDVVSKGGCVTFDLGPNYDEKFAPVGSFDTVQLKQLRTITAASGGNLSGQKTANPLATRRVCAFSGN